MFHTLLLRKVVVGGSSGIGFAVCEEFLRSGAKVLSLSRSATAACGAQHIPCDLNSHSSIAEAADAVSAVYGRSPTPITLILNAGHGKSDSARSVTQESLMQHLSINVVSQVRRKRQDALILISCFSFVCLSCICATLTAEQCIFTAQVLPLLAPTSSIIWIGSTLSDRLAKPRRQ